MDKVLFYDENGDEIEFIIEAKFSLDDDEYVALYPAEDEEVLYILKIEYDEKGDEVLVGIDDNELKEAQEAYEELMKENLN